MNSDKGFGLNMAVFDLNLRTPRRHTSGSHRKEMTHELGKDRLCSAYGFSAHIRIPSMRRALSRRLQGQDFFLLGPVSFDVFCPTHLQRKPARHRGLSSCSRTKALPHGDTREGIPEYAGQRQPSQRLAHLRGFSARARKLYVHDSFGIDLGHTVYALDSTTIDLCLSLFPWAEFRKHKGAVKLHTLLDLRGSIPTVIVITHGRVHDVNILDQISIEAGAFYLMDRGISTLPVFTESTNRGRSLSPGQGATSGSNAYIPGTQTNQQGFNATK